MGIKLLNCFMYVVVALYLVQLTVGIKLSRYTKLSKEVGKRLKSYDRTKSRGYPHEYGFGYYYQGDILLRPGQGGRFATLRPFKEDLWPNATVPYVIDALYSDREMETLAAAFEQFHNRTCVRFIPRTDELQYVTITNEEGGCVSNVGRSPDPMNNQLNLQSPDCLWLVGTPVHEMMHTLGFYHEQSRPDRDEYIEIFPENIAPKYQKPGFFETNFGKYDEGDGTDYGVPYNYGSVMHYSRVAAAISVDRPVLTNKKPYFGDFGSPDGLTEGDIEQLMARYCSEEW